MYWLTILTLTLLTPLIWSEDVLRPEFGVHFGYAGELEPAVDYYEVTVHLALPSIDARALTKFKTPECELDDLDEYTKMICKDYTAVFANYRDTAVRLETDLLNKLEAIKSVITRTRQKRGLPLLALGGIFSGGLSILSGYIQHKRTASLQKAIKFLGRAQYKLHSDFYDFRQDMLTLAELNTNDTVKNSRDILILSYKMKHFTSFVEVQFQKINGSLQILSKRFYALRLVSILSARMHLFLQQRLSLLHSLISTTDKIISALSDLMNGRIPISLIPPNELQRILSHSQSVLYETNPTYKLAFDQIDDYYRLDNVGYVFDSNRLIISLSIPILQSNQHALSLYKMSTVYVPTDVNDPSSKSFTRLELEYDYLAYYDNNFIELTNAQLKSCISYTDRFLCDTTLLQIHRSKLTCAIAIFWDSNQSLIKRLCQFNYYNNIRPSAQVIESDQNILLAHIETPWTISCAKSSMPIRHKGHTFVIINRETLCGCNLVSNSHFIAPKISGCTKMNNITLRYPLNGAMMLYFAPNSSLRLNTLYDYIPDVKLPHIDPIKLNSKDVILEDSQGVSLARYHDVISKYKESYWRDTDKIKQDSFLPNWFKGSNYGYGIMFLFSILGSFSTFLTIFCYVSKLKGFKDKLKANCCFSKHGKSVKNSNCYEVIELDEQGDNYLTPVSDTNRRHTVSFT